MKTMCSIKNAVCLSALIPTIMLSGCADLAFVRPTDQQTITGSFSPGTTTVDVPIEIDFTGSTSARNIVLDGNINITTAPAAGFITRPGGGQNGWDRMSGKYPMASGTHTLTASAEYLDYTRTTQTISKTLRFAAFFGQRFLYVGSSVPAIEIFEITPDNNGLPQMMRRPGTAPSLTIGSPNAMTVVDKSLYVAGDASVAQFTIDPMSGALTLRGTVPTGIPPQYMAATKTTVYVASYGSNNISVYSIDAAGKLTNMQTAAANGVNSLQVEGIPGKFLFTGHRASGPTVPQVCAHTIQANGSLGATPNCVAVGGAPQAMQVSGGVLYLLFNAIVPPVVGNTNWISAWTINPTTGALTHRGTDIDIGAANTGGMAVSTDGQTLFIPRQGGFTTVGTANPLTYATITFPPTYSQWCLLPPVGAGGVLADPTGKAIYITDPVGAVTGNIIGPRVSAIEVAGGGLKAVVCDTAGRLPQSMAIFP